MTPEQAERLSMSLWLQLSEAERNAVVSAYCERPMQRLTQGEARRLRGTERQPKRSEDTHDT